MADSERYHIVLIGCDQYPPGQRSLRGCVNDIDAIEHMLLDEPGVGLPTSQLNITRLAAPREGAASSSRYLAETKLPTKANIVAALQALARPNVSPQDRVLIYYSGHGGQVQRHSREGWFECLVPCDEQLLFDDELNARITAITERTSDLTVVLDCCHSAGATRDIYGEPEHGASRVAELRDPPDEPPDSVLLDRGVTDRKPGMHLLQTVDPNYLVLCYS